jgi:serine/threonine-protein kinase
VAAPALVEKAKARIGSVLRDKWKLDSLLGVGGSAAVYAATHRNGKRGAIKLLHPELSKQEELVARFLREGYVANKIDHPGSVIILDDDITDDGMAFLVMELLEGYTLERRLRKRSAVPVREALKMTEDLLDVLQVAHEKGIIHRDIKPANIFITRDKVLKVLDFGIARLGEQSSQPVGDTQMGQALGTPAFMPPEQARGRWDEVDVRTDIWSVGATLWALLSGQRPRRAETSNEELLLAMTQPLPAIASVALHVSPEVAKIVDRAVAFEMAARWPNARTMQQAVRLAALLEQASSPSEFPDPSGPQSLFEISLNTPAAVQADFDGLDEPSADGKSAPKSTYGGPLSMSRFDALGPRIPRQKSSAPSSPALPGLVLPSGLTPTGDARLLTTSHPIVMPVPEPVSWHPPKKKRRGWIVAVGLVTMLALAAGVAQQTKLVDLRRLASPSTPDAIVPAPPTAPAPSAAPSAAPSIAATTLTVPEPSASAAPSATPSAAPSSLASASASAQSSAPSIVSAATVAPPPRFVPRRPQAPRPPPAASTPVEEPAL